MGLNAFKPPFLRYKLQKFSQGKTQPKGGGEKDYQYAQYTPGPLPFSDRETAYKKLTN